MFDNFQENRLFNMFNSEALHNCMFYRNSKKHALNIKSDKKKFAMLLLLQRKSDRDKDIDT